MVDYRWAKLLTSSDLFDRLNRSSNGASTPINMKKGLLTKGSIVLRVLRQSVTKLVCQFTVTKSSRAFEDENDIGLAEPFTLVIDVRVVLTGEGRGVLPMDRNDRCLAVDAALTVSKSSVSFASC